MISITKKFKSGLIVMVSLIVILSSCNKEVEQFPFINESGTTSIVEKLATMPSDTLYRRLIIRAGLSTTLSNRALTYTIFVVDNATMRAFLDAFSGGTIPPGPGDSSYSAYIANTLNAGLAANIVNYYTVPQKFTTSQFVHLFPNLELQNNLIVQPGNPFARMRVHVSRNPSTGIYYVDNIPLSATDSMAGLSVIHRMAAFTLPPQRMVWDRINTDPDLTIFKAALQRADSGYTPATPGSLIGGMMNFGANFTVLAPSNLAMKTTLSALTGIPIISPDATFIGFLGSASINTQTVKGIVVYHLPGERTAPGAAVSPIKIYTVNVSTAATPVLTFLNNPGPGVNHPGVIMQASFTGPSATALTVKGLANPTASNVAINPTPDLNPTLPVMGTSDQNYINGVLHKIDQVLLPL